MTSPRVNLLDFDADQMAAYVAGLNEKPFRAKQLMQWIHQRGVSDINDMSDLAKSFRASLLDKAEVLSLPVIKDERAADGTRKWLLDVGVGNAVESVFIPEEERLSPDSGNGLKGIRFTLHLIFLRSRTNSLA